MSNVMGKFLHVTEALIPEEADGPMVEDVCDEESNKGMMNLFSDKFPYFHTCSCRLSSYCPILLLFSLSANIKCKVSVIRLSDDASHDYWNGSVSQ